MQCKSIIKWKTKLREIVIRLNPSRATLINNGRCHLSAESDRDPRDDDTWQIIVDPQHEAYGIRSCRDRELWHVRQAFLTSYHFSVRDGGGGGRRRRKLLRWAKETRVLVVEAGTRFGRTVRVNWVDFKTTKLVLFRGVAISLVSSCFVPMGHESHHM